MNPLLWINLRENETSRHRKERLFTAPIKQTTDLYKTLWGAVLEEKQTCEEREKSRTQCEVFTVYSYKAHKLKE